MNIEYETGFQIINHSNKLGYNHHEVKMVLVGNHAPFTMALLTRQINLQSPKLKAALIKKHFERKHGPDSYYDQ